MPSFRITLSYDGTDVVGWQRQASGTSIQGLLEDALAALEGAAVAAIAAGRTDAGVHALGQVAAFTLTRPIEATVLRRALNARLPGAVRVLEAVDVPADFHPQFLARTKTYRYRLWTDDAVSPFERRYVWHVPGALDVAAMHAAARLLEGTQDFAAFQASGSETATTVRTIVESVVGRAPLGDRAGNARSPIVEYTVRGNGFLRHMVRTIVGTLVEVGRGRRRPDSVRALIRSRDRAAAGPTAPPSGLFLVRVDF
jgi:tRNA pseudouridine38-40 synthase